MYKKSEKISKIFSSKFSFYQISSKLLTIFGICEQNKYDIVDKKTFLPFNHAVQYSFCKEYTNEKWPTNK